MWNRIRNRVNGAVLSRQLSIEDRLRRLREQLEPEEGAMTIEYILIIALIAAVLGFSGVAGTATNIAWILFVVFLIIAAISFVSGRSRVL